MYSGILSHRAALAIAGALLVGACATPWPSYERPALDLPPVAASGLSIDRQWWRAFGDPVLDGLVDEALANNFDLAKAAAAIAEAQAAAGAARAMLSPRIDAAGKAQASQRQLSLAADIDNINEGSAWVGAGLRATWEADLWGRIAQLNDAALARVSASEHTRNAVALSVSAAVAETYFQLRALEEKLALTREAAGYLAGLAQLEFRRWKGAAGTQLAYRQALAEQTAMEARLPVLESAVAQTELALRLLVGSSPRQMTLRIPPSQAMPVPPPPREFDSELLLRRPDVASAEQLLAATQADLNAVRAERYPRLSLSLLGGILASTSSAISGSPVYWDLTAGLTAPIFDAGLIQSRTEGAAASQEKAVAHYRYTVSLAYRETYEALVRVDTGDRQVVSSESEVATRRQALALVKRSFDAGRSSMFEVLGETTKVVNAQMGMVDARQNQLIARSRYYKALGGGY
jgi:multidrug efflux system outer membrane protein